jgi:hypothetical protein
MSTVINDRKTENYFDETDDEEDTKFFKETSNQSRTILKLYFNN